MEENKYRAKFGTHFTINESGESVKITKPGGETIELKLSDVVDFVVEHTLKNMLIEKIRKADSSDLMEFIAKL